MKAKVLLLGAVVAAFAVASLAAEPLLSPRAAGNQAKVITSSIDTQGGTITYVAPASTALLSPRAAGNQPKVVAGVAGDSNPALACRSRMAGSPKAVTECASHPGAPMSCCVTVMAK